MANATRNALIWAILVLVLVGAQRATAADVLEIGQRFTYRPFPQPGGAFAILERLQLTPDNRYVLAEAQPDIRVAARNPITGELSGPVDVFPPPPLTMPVRGVSTFALSPDGLNVYGLVFDGIDASGFSTEFSIVVLDFDPSNGSLATKQVLNLADFVVGPGLIQEPDDVSVSDDGLNVYVLAGGNAQLLAFSRAVDGQLSFLESVFDTGGQLGLFLPDKHSLLEITSMLAAA